MHRFDKILLVLLILLGSLLFLPFTPGQSALDNSLSLSNDKDQMAGSSVVVQNSNELNSNYIKGGTAMNAAASSENISNNLESEITGDPLSDYDLPFTVTVRQHEGYSDYRVRTCLTLLEKVATILPSDHIENIDTVVLDFDSLTRRGLTGGGHVTLRCPNVTNSEFMAVAIHEFGHAVDIAGFQGSSNSGDSPFYDGSLVLFQNDASVQYYAVSWDNSDTAKDNSVKKDFVSGYAASNPFEDLAEAYAMYVLHGQSFRKLAENNAVLRQKYEFLRDVYFGGREYDLPISYEFSDDVRPFDMTVLPYSFKEFLALSQ